MSASTYLYAKIAIGGHKVYYADVGDIVKKVTTISLDKAVNNDTFGQNMDELEQISNTSSKSPSERGEESISGSTPGPESDDDVLRNAHLMGIAPDADLEHPTELNLAKDIEDADKYRKSH